MRNPHIVNLIYSLFLIVVGISGFLLRYFEVGDFQFTALIPAAFGLVLLPLGNGIKRQHKVISHVAVLLTLILAVFALIMVIMNAGDGFLISRRGIIFTLILISSATVLSIYIARFISISKSKRDVLAD
jgi:lysylphosphatidylglycerol synthetase-like protein (DUF2156 family)